MWKKNLDRERNVREKKEKEKEGLFLLRFLGSPSITVKGSKGGREHKMLLGCCHPPSILLSLLLLSNSLSRRVSTHSPSFDYTSNTLKDMKLLHSYGAECKPSPSAFTDIHTQTHFRFHFLFRRSFFLHLFLSISTHSFLSLLFRSRNKEKEWKWEKPAPAAIKLRKRCKELRLNCLVTQLPSFSHSLSSCSTSSLSRFISSFSSSLLTDITFVSFLFSPTFSSLLLQMVIVTKHVRVKS